MSPSGSRRQLAPVATDVEAAVALAKESVEEGCRRASPPLDPAPRVAHVSERLRSGSVEGRLYRADRQSVGIVLWEPEGAASPGLHVEVLHLAAPFRSEEEYGRFLDRVRSEVGAIRFLPTGLSGLDPDQEGRVASARGFSRFGRSEMRLPADAPLPGLTVPPGLRIRPLRSDDEPSAAAVHAAAFGKHFDFYLFQNDPDPRRSSAREVHDIMHGRWGEFLPWASFLAESEDHRVCGACLFVRAPYGPLLINLAVDPSAQGKGIGRALTTASVRALRERGETVIALNVTEGNGRAVRMYEQFGFVRSLGPEWAWYSTEIVPVAPDGSPSRPAPVPEPTR